MVDWPLRIVRYYPIKAFQGSPLDSWYRQSYAVVTLVYKLFDQIGLRCTRYSVFSQCYHYSVFSRYFN